MAARVGEAGATMLDAPVSGSVPQVQAGTLTIMVGGSEDAYLRVEPLMRELGTPTRIGDNGQGLALKLADEHQPRRPDARLLRGCTADRATFVGAAVVMVGTTLAGRRWRLPDVSGLDRGPAVYWPDATLAFEPDVEAGPVLVTAAYNVPVANSAAFVTAMSDLELSRRRTGASDWQLYRDGPDPQRFLEVFEVPSWDTHLRQHGGRHAPAWRPPDRRRRRDRGTSRRAGNQPIERPPLLSGGRRPHRRQRTERSQSRRVDRRERRPKP